MSSIKCFKSGDAVWRHGYTLSIVTSSGNKQKVMLRLLKNCSKTHSSSLVFELCAGMDLH